MPYECKQLTSAIQEIKENLIVFDRPICTIEDVETVLGVKIKIQELLQLIDAEIGYNFELAEKILGSDFIGPSKIALAYGIELNEQDIPAIPFSFRELKRAKDLKQFLILRTNKVPEDDLMLKDHEKEYEGEVKTGWALVGKDIVPGTIKKNFLEQVQVIIEYLINDVFADREIPLEYQDAIAEFESKRGEIEEPVKSYMAVDFKPAADALASLKITKLTLPSFKEATYDLEVYNRINQIYPRFGYQVWTSTQEKRTNANTAGGQPAVGCIFAVGVLQFAGPSMIRINGVPARSSDDEKLAVAISRTM